MAHFNTTANGPIMDNFDPLPDPIISDEAREWIDGLLKSVLFPFAILGTVTNAINMLVFIQQNVLSDTNTICLFALAVTDFLSCAFLVPTIVCGIMKHVPGQEINAVSCYNMGVIGCELPHVMLSHINCCITVYIAFERTLCVLIPFKVKAILRPKLAITVMAAIYGIIIVSYLPFLTTIGISWQMDEKFNVSAAHFTITDFGVVTAAHLSFVYNAIVSTSGNILTAGATGLMLYKLNQFSKWRKQAASAGNAKQEDEDDSDNKTPAKVQGKKELEMLKAVTMVTVLFVVCTSMSLIPGFAYLFVPGMSVIGVNKNLEHVSHISKFVFDSINSSLNFFFYVRISTKYRSAYNEVFRKKKA